MGRPRRCGSSEEEVFNRRAWTPEEDKILSQYIEIHGDHSVWANLPQKAGLKRHGKSCRLRWLNYLRPDIKRGNISPDEEELLIRMHRLLGNRWSLIAGRLPGRTDNEIKNYWNTHLRKKLAIKESERRTLAMKESERRTQILKRRATSPSPLQNHVFKPSPVKIPMAARDSEIGRPNGCCNGDGSNHIPAEAAVKLSNVQETTNSSQSGWCDLYAKNSIVDNESKLIVFEMVHVNHVGTEVTNSTCSMSSLEDGRQSPLSDDFAQSLTDLDELLFPDINLLSSPSNCLLTDFGLEEFYKGQAFIDSRHQ